MRIGLAIHGRGCNADAKPILTQTQPLIAMGARLRPYAQDQVRTLPDITGPGHGVSAPFPIS